MDYVLTSVAAVLLLLLGILRTFRRPKPREFCEICGGLHEPAPPECADKPSQWCLALLFEELDELSATAHHGDPCVKCGIGLPDPRALEMCPNHPVPPRTIEIEAMAASKQNARRKQKDRHPPYDRIEQILEEADIVTHEDGFCYVMISPALLNELAYIARSAQKGEPLPPARDDVTYAKPKGA